MDPALPAILVPARRASTRLPEKLLLADSGTPLLVHALRAAANGFGTAQVIACCDDHLLVRIAAEAGFAAQLTDPGHQSGSARIAEVAATLDNTVIVNVQGDEPEMDPAHIRLVAALLERHPWAAMATLCTAAGPTEQADPASVKVCRSGERAVWFSRAPCPWDREAAGPAAACERHLGIYAYRREVLLNWHSLPPCPLEELECLEQLRALGAGLGIACAQVAWAAPGIDTPADYDAFLARLRLPPAAADSSGAPVHGPC